ncbi:MAG: heme exporter protein CcmD [Thiotrichales bacterium]
MKTISDFFSQGGYAFFVWSSYGMTAALLIAEIWFLRHHRHTIVNRVKRLIRLEARKP